MSKEREYLDQGTDVIVNEYLNNTLYINHDFKILEQKGYEIEETQFEIVKEKLIKFLEFISDNKRLKTTIFKFKYPINIL
jgi:predicted metal-dependent peptidase